MTSKRPTLPTGFQVDSYPPIARSIYVNEFCEIYALDSDTTEDKVLILYREDVDENVFNKLNDWLSELSKETLISFSMLGTRLLGVAFTGAVLIIGGRRASDFPYPKASRETLRQLFIDMLDCCEQNADLFPVFDLSCCWVGNDGLKPIFLKARSRIGLDESQQLRLTAEAFYRAASGRLWTWKGSPPSPLEKWARSAGPELSAVLNLCLASIDNKDRINSISDARSALVEGLKSIQRADSKRSPEKIGLRAVAGMHRLKSMLEREVVAPIRDPQPFKRYGLTVPNGVLLYGPPGCGKTYIARKLAEELGHHFVEVIPSEIASPYIHQSVIRIRELFDEAAMNAPSIVFIDEFEALTPARSELGASQQYKSEEVNEFLAHLNGCAEKRIFVVAATNQPDKIDPAVRRTGRLDKLIFVGPPDEEARTEMLSLHLRGRPLSPSIDVRQIAIALKGYSASDLKFLVDEAARHALQNGVDIGEDSFAAAIPKVRPSVPAEVEEEYKTIYERG